MRPGGRTHGEIPLLLGSLAVAVLAQTVGARLGVSENILTVIGGSLFLAQAYFLLLLARRFASIRAATLTAAGAGLIVAILFLIVGNRHLTTLPLAFIYALYLCTVGYAVLLFVREMRRKRGVVPRRMLAIALGTVAIILAILFPAVSTALGLSLSQTHLLAATLALAASIEYVVGFTPPSWLLRRWQMPEIASFIRDESRDRDIDAAMARLAVVALRITGAKWVGVIQTVGVHASARWYGISDEPEPPPSHFDARLGGLLAQAATESKPGVSRTLDDLPEGLRSWVVQSGVQEYSAVPIGSREHQVGLLLVLASRGFLFAHDDVDLLVHLAHHTAVTVENVRLLDAATREAARLSVVNGVMEALMRPLDQDVLAREIVRAIFNAVSADVAELFTLDPDGLLTRIAKLPEDDTPLRLLSGTGVPGLAAQQRMMVFSEDVQSDERFARREEALREGYRSALAVPLFAQGVPVGVYTLIHKHSHSYTEDEEHILQALAAPIAAALHNAILHHTAEKRLQQFTTLHESAVALAAERSVDALLSRIADAARRLTDARYGALSTLDEDGRIARFVTSGLNGAPNSHSLSMPTGRGLLGDVLYGGKVIRIADIAAHPRALGLPPGHPPMRSLLGVPIAYDGQTLGMLYVSEAPREEFSEVDESALQGLAALAAVAITNANLFARLDDARQAAERANEELADANRAKSDFLASVSHELRTPLNAILGFTELMLDDDGLALERRRHYLETVHTSGKHLLSLINDILDLSKIEAGRMDLQIEDFDASLAIREVLTAVEPLATQGGLQLAGQSEPGMRVQADRGKFKQILYNLISNAIKFTDKGGSVEVECHRRENEFILSVADTGIGIAPDDQQRIFDAFQQLDASSERQYKGTGLGLALVRQFVLLHSGRITVQSQLGQGSRFEVCLPSRTGMSDSEVAAASTHEVTDAPLILVVEDDPRSEALLRHSLEGAGYRVATAHNGEEALVKARALLPTAITLDVLLPGIDGWGVLEVLKSDPQTRNLPVVVVTVADDRRRAYALGASDYFVKPVNRDVLLERLARYTNLPGSRRTVLAVDDEQASLDLTAGILQGAGYRVIVAHNGGEALELVRCDPPDVILLDLLMPEMSGVAVLAELRRMEATREVPVLILTARDLTEEDKRQLSGTALAVLHKGEHANADLVQWIRFALGIDNMEEHP